MIIEIMNALPQPAVLIGADERIEAMNDAARTFLDHTFIGRHHAFVLRQPEMQNALHAACVGRVKGRARHVASEHSVEAGIYEVTLTPLGEKDGVLCVFEDVSTLERTEEMRRVFVANVSHELRTPLTALIGFIDTLRGPARDDPEAQTRFYDIMAREAGRMNRLVDDLLHLSRLEVEGRNRPHGQVALADILKTTITTLSPMAEEAGVRLVLEGIDAAPGTMPGDSDQLVQVFSNLLENAVKYGKSGGCVRLRVARDNLPYGGAVRVDVIDYGEGIAAEHIPRLSERFYRVDDHRSRGQGGTGLGLAIVKHAVQRHRGRLVIQSVCGEGSTFSVLLPI